MARLAGRVLACTLAMTVVLPPTAARSSQREPDRAVSGATEWAYSVEKDLMTDKTAYWVLQRPYAATQALMVRCDEDTTLVAVIFEGRLDEDTLWVPITVRFDRDDAEQTRFRVLATTVLTPGQGPESARFIERMLSADERLVVRVTTFFGQTETIAFDLSNFEVAWAEIVGDCDMS